MTDEAQARQAAIDHVRAALRLVDSFACRNAGMALQEALDELERRRPAETPTDAELALLTPETALLLERIPIAP